jgi:MshEN domain
VNDNHTPKQLGQMLIERGLLTREQLDRALREHRSMPKSLGRTMIDLGYIGERDLVSALAEQVGLDFVDLSQHEIDPAAARLLPGQLARRYRAIPIGEADGKLLVAMSDPANLIALDDIRAVTNREIQPVVATATDVEQAIEKSAATLMGDLLSVTPEMVGEPALATEPAEATEQAAGTEFALKTEPVAATEPEGALHDLDERTDIFHRPAVAAGAGTISSTSSRLEGSIERLVTATWVLAASTMGLIFAMFVLIIITAMK